MFQRRQSSHGVESFTKDIIMSSEKYLVLLQDFAK